MINSLWDWLSALCRKTTPSAMLSKFLPLHSLWILYVCTSWNGTICYELDLFALVHWSLLYHVSKIMQAKSFLQDLDKTTGTENFFFGENPSMSRSFDWHPSRKLVRKWASFWCFLYQDSLWQTDFSSPVCKEAYVKIARLLLRHFVHIICTVD